MPTLFGRLGERIAAAGTEMIRRVAGPFAARPFQAATQASASNPSAYDLRDLMYSGDIYKFSRDGGGLKYVLKQLGRGMNSAGDVPSQNEPFYAMAGYYNPVKQIVDFYANAFGGRLGKDIEIAEEFNGKPIAKPLPDLVRRVWQWSNLDARNEELTTLAANQGTVGIRIVAKLDDPASPRIYLDFDHPAAITRVDLDNRGNVISAFLEYQILTFDENGGVSNTIKVEEVISKYGFSQLFDGTEQLTAEQKVNPLGVCPYVLLRHKLKPGDTFGAHAYEGSERAIHGINFGLSQLDESVVAHVWPYLFATSPAEEPQKIRTGRYTLMYAQTREGEPAPTLQSLVPSR